MHHGKQEDVPRPYGKPARPPVVVVVPIGKAYETALIAVRGSAEALGSLFSVTVLDLWGSAAQAWDDGPPPEVIDDLGMAHSLGGGLVVAQERGLHPDEDLYARLRFCMRVVEACEDLVGGARAVVVVAPPYVPQELAGPGCTRAWCAASRTTSCCAAPTPCTSGTPTRRGLR